MAAPTQADREGFAALAARLLVTRGIVSSAEPRMSAFALDVVADGVPRTLHLHDMLTEALGASPQERTSVVTSAARWMLGQPSPQSWDEVQSSLLPVIRNAWFGPGETIRDRFHPDPHLAVFFAWTVPGEGLRYASQADVASWGIDATLVRDRCYRNFGRAHERLEWEVAVDPHDDGALRISAQGLEASSLVLFPLGRISGLLTREAAHPVVAIPARNVLLARRARPDALPRLAESAAAEHLAASQPLCGIPFAIAEGAMPAAEIAMHPATVAARRRLRIETYGAQARQLRVKFPDEEIPEPEERIGDLICSWSEGRHALLPECGSVKLVPKKKGSRPVSLEWWSVKSLIGSTFQQEPDLFPPRWRAFPWKRDDVRAFDGEEDEDEAEPDPEAEAHFAEEEAQWGYDEGSGDEEAHEDDDVWHEGDPDVLCPFCGSGLRGEKTCEVCGRAPGEARGGSAPAAAPTHAIRVLQALVEGKHLELANRRALAAVGRAIAETLDGTADWAAQAATLSARLLSMEQVAEVFVDDAALAELLARTAADPATPDPRIETRMKEMERAEADTLRENAGAVLARKILRELMNEGALEIEWDELSALETALGSRVSASAPPDSLARTVFDFLLETAEDGLRVESADELVEIVTRLAAEMPAPAVPSPPEPPAIEKNEIATLPAAKRLLRRLFDEGLAEMVAGGSQELVENAIAELLASPDAKDPEALHALLDEMDEDVVLFADAATLAKLPKR